MVKDEEYTIDVSTLDNKPIDEDLYEAGKNEFSFTLPTSGTIITYQLLTGKLEKAIEREVAGLKKINKDRTPNKEEFI